MRVEQIVPRAEQEELEPLLDRLRAPGARLAPFASEALEVCARFSAVLFRDEEARRYPELQALAFWMRKAELTRLQAQFASFESGGVLLVPRGLVFHVPPSNVDTIFLYSWVLSMLVGNANIIRLSQRTGTVSSIICRVLNGVLREGGVHVANNTAVIRYAHEREINELISAAADVRVLWGGDQSVRTMRSAPLAPHSQDLTFPDRFSLAAISSAAWLAQAHEAKQAAVAQFFNDTYWFDQMACSSPRILAWCGGAEDSTAASTEFYELLASEIENKRYELPAGPRLQKLAFAYGAILDLPVTRVSGADTQCTILELDHASSLPREHCGGGLLYQIRIERLNDLAALIEARHQTLTHFGFAPEELRALVRALNGRGVDRIVPMGRALRFGRVWDGYDLLRSFTRAVYIES